MARLTAAPSCAGSFGKDERGAVYVEFLIVFLPVFVTFLGICQLALIAAARFVVQHAAGAAARSAVVILESDPSDFSGVPRGSVSGGSGTTSSHSASLLESLGVKSLAEVSEDSNTDDRIRRQQGARMVPIRFTAYVPLMVLAPLEKWLEPAAREGSLGEALSGGARSELAAALAYNRSAAVVTLQSGAGSDELASEPIDRRAPVTVRVTYLYYCSIPVVRALGCKTLAELVGPADPVANGGRTESQRRTAQRFALVEDPRGLVRLAFAGARFAVLTGETTLPNQGAGYYQ